MELRGGDGAEMRSSERRCWSWGEEMELRVGDGAEGWRWG